MTRAIALLLGVTMAGCAAVLEAPRTPAGIPLETIAASGSAAGEPLGFRVRVTVRYGDEVRAASALGLEGWNAEDVTLDDVTFVACVARPMADPAMVRMEVLGRCANAGRW